MEGYGFAAGVGFDATGLAGNGFETAGLVGDGFDAIGLAGVGFEAAVGGTSDGFTGPFLMAASDTSAINTATAVKTAYTIVLI